MANPQRFGGFLLRSIRPVSPDTPGGQGLLGHSDRDRHYGWSRVRIAANKLTQK
ncbi:hypothetical protein NG799_19405 [Laspinema sp. D1]|uniref:Uncharacterized protein n=1 Tax=Laspinema palackyanum D2a TaxID=2953684 RepID=A0ABT2MYA6_9CYAN|nr:hypothetical protein [Laspinema sp. D2a]